LTEVDPGLLAYKPQPQKPQKIVDVLISFLETDEAAEAARQRLASKPKAKGSKPATPDEADTSSSTD
jgi:hypothetical protein